MILDSEQQRAILLHALQDAGFRGVSKMLVGECEFAVKQAVVDDGSEEYIPQENESTV